MKTFLLICIALCSVAFATPPHSGQLNPVLKLIYACPESAHLIKQAEALGPFSIKVAQLGENVSNAIWLPDDRIIYVNISKQRPLESLLCSVLFELHNVLSTNEFNQLDALAMSGQISRQKYIEAVEKIEYKNAVDTTRIIAKGIYAHIFPRHTRWPICADFKEHLEVQQLSGHSAFIGCMYDELKRQTPVAYGSLSTKKR